MNPRRGAMVFDFAEHRQRRLAAACAVERGAVSVRRRCSVPGAFWRLGAFHISAIAMTYGAPLLGRMLEDYRIQLAAWTIYVAVGALQLSALRPFALWISMLIAAGLDLYLAQSWVGLWLTYSLVFLTKEAVSMLSDCVR